jgi:hypothetical protein
LRKIRRRRSIGTNRRVCVSSNAVASTYDERAREVDEDVRALHDLLVTCRTLEPLTEDGR